MSNRISDKAIDLAVESMMHLRPGFFRDKSHARDVLTLLIKNVTDKDFEPGIVNYSATAGFKVELYGDEDGNSELEVSYNILSDYMDGENFYLWTGDEPELDDEAESEDLLANDGKPLRLSELYESYCLVGKNSADALRRVADFIERDNLMLESINLSYGSESGHRVVSFTVCR